MKPSNRNSAIIIVLIIAVIVAAILLISRGHKEASSNDTTKKSLHETANPTSITVTSTQKVTGPTRYPAAIRAKVRSDFINSCSDVVGRQHVSECNCAADYLAANYSDAQLAKLYLDYHLSTQVPGEIKAAIKSCSGK
jgi:hypothetical protein